MSITPLAPVTIARFVDGFFGSMATRSCDSLLPIWVVAWTVLARLCRRLEQILPFRSGRVGGCFLMVFVPSFGSCFIFSFLLSTKYSDSLWVPWYDFLFRSEDAFYKAVHEFGTEKNINYQMWGYAEPNLVHRSPRRRCCTISSTSGNGCFVTFRSVRSLFRFMCSFHLLGIMKELNRFTFAPMSRRQAAVCITVVIRPYDIRLSYFCFAVRAMMLTCEWNSVGSAHGTVHLQNFLVFFTFTPTFGR